MSIRKLGIYTSLLFLVCLIVGAIGCGLGAPSAQFTANSTAGNAPVSVWFTDLSTGKIDGWEWDFDNDGVVDSTDQYVPHVYENPGDYTVKLTVRGDGGTDSEVKSSYIVVSPPSCKADFSAEPLICHGATTVQFTDLSSGDVTGWAWNFDNDDGIESYEQNPAYTFSQDGLYSIILTITTANCSDTITKDGYISVSDCNT